jgi:gentisate 1,2-dioxygenase
MNSRNTNLESQLSRKAYYDRIGADNMTPLWEVLGALVPHSPQSPAVTHLWKYADVREQVMEAGRLISAAEAERRRDLADARTEVVSGPPARA